MKIWAVMIAILPLAQLHCSSPARPGSAPDGFVHRFALAAEPGAAAAPRADNSLHRNYPVVRRGRRLESLVLVAPASARASLDGTEPESLFECLAAPVANIGDGLRVDVFVTPGEQTPVWTRYFDPARKFEDRNWIPVSVPLRVRDPGSAALEIRVSGGPQGDLVYDWIALANVSVRPLRPR